MKDNREDIYTFDDDDFDADEIYTEDEYITEDEDNSIDGGNESSENFEKDTVEDDEEEEDEDVVVYLVIDRQVTGLINYFRECGINISNIYNSIEGIRNKLIRQYGLACRIIIADTGLGKFTTTKIRQEIIDLLGACDENNKFTVFYTDSVLKMDAIGVIGKNKSGIDWFKYTSTIDMVVNILKYRESYKLGRLQDIDDTMASKTDLMNVMGVQTNIELEEPLEIKGLSYEHLIKNMLESDTEQLVKYNIKI